MLEPATAPPSPAAARTKPLLRGVSHQVAFFLAPLAVLALWSAAATPRAAQAALVYGVSLGLMYGISALYHRRNWSPPARVWMKRLDHCGIFLLIAGTYTPVCLLGVPDGGADLLLQGVWAGAVLGILRSLFWVKAPRALTALLYVLLGCSLVPFVPRFQATLGPGPLWLIASGGVLYIVGAVIYALKRPDPFPRVFGYHEVFHLLVIAASALHLTAVLQVVSLAR